MLRQDTPGSVSARAELIRDRSTAPRPAMSITPTVNARLFVSTGSAVADVFATAPSGPSWGFDAMATRQGGDVIPLTVVSPSPGREFG